MGDFFLTVDLGTTSVKLIWWSEKGEKVLEDSFPVELRFPFEGGVEFDPETMVEELVKRINHSPFPLQGMGITNQRETTIVWNEEGKLVYPAIVWQDRRTATWCEAHREKEDWLFQKTGLFLDPYFSLSKLVWILEKVKTSHPLYFGTLDTYVLWVLTAGKVFSTDYTNASRTLIFNLHNLCWDEEIIKEFELEKVLFPQVVPSFHLRGETQITTSSVPVYVVLGDQQASFLGQGCFEKGSTKNTYGTGCFLMTNQGKDWPEDTRRLLITLASLEEDEPIFALEASTFSAGVIIEWLKRIGLIKSPQDIEEMAVHARPLEEFLLVPAFCGLGAPYWDPFARGAILGLTPQVGKEELVRGALEAVAFEVGDLIKIIDEISPGEIKELSVDGGLSQSRYLLQFQADLSGKTIRVFPEKEATSLGVFYLWANRSGLLSREFIEEKKQKALIFEPRGEEKERKKLEKKWQRGIDKVRGWAKNE